MLDSFTFHQNLKTRSSVSMAPSASPHGGNTTPPTSEQETLLLVNTFCATTVDMLNAVSVTCERKLTEHALRIQRVEAKLVMLEKTLEGVRDGNVSDTGKQ